MRGFEFTHETVRDWEARFAPVFADQLRVKRKGRVGKIWHVDETFIRVKGRETVRTEISRLVIEKENLDKALKVLILHCT